MNPLQTIRKQFNLPGLILGSVLIVVSCLLYFSFGTSKPAILRSIDNQIMDLMFTIRGQIPDSGQVVIVDIDEKSLQQFGQWPWPRNLLARLTEILFQNGARSIGFDIVFAEKDRTSPANFFKNLEQNTREQIPQATLSRLINEPDLDYDAMFGNALSMGPSVLGYAFKMQNDHLKKMDSVPFPSSIIRITPAMLSFQDLALIPAYRAIINHPDVSMADSEGFFNVFEDEAGTTRQVPLIMAMDGIPYPSLALETFRMGMAIKTITILASKQKKTPATDILGIYMGNQFYPTDGHGQLMINYRGPAGTFPYISAAQILTNNSVSQVKDRFILIGSSATGLFDLKTTPLSSVIPGIEINANIIDNLIQADPFSYDIFSEIGMTYTLIISGGILISLILACLGPLAGTISALVFLAGSVIWNYQVLFLNNQYMGISFPFLSSFTILFTTIVFNAFRERKTKKFVQKAFSQYVSPEVVTDLIANPDTLSLAGEERELTILFCDIRGFTSISENLNPRDLGNFMNEFLTRMSRIIIDNDGTVDKFIGDAIMAFWGAPRPDQFHAYKAVHAALEMKAELERFALEFKKGPRSKIKIGIGINSGMVSVGNFGSRQRFDYTVMGDNVNLASRLEGANKNYGTTILVSSMTKQMARQSFFFQYIDKVIVKGRTQAVDLFEPLCIGAPPESLRKTVEQFEKGLRFYQSRDFETAREIIKGLHKKDPLRLYQAYLDRIEGFIKHPPHADWHGEERRRELPATRLTEK